VDEDLVNRGVALLTTADEIPRERMALASALRRLDPRGLAARLTAVGRALGQAADTSAYWALAECCRDQLVDTATADRLVLVLADLLTAAKGPHVVAILEQQLPGLLPASAAVRSGLVHPLAEVAARYIDDRTRDLVGTALVDLGVRELNRRTVLVPLRTAQSLLGLPGRVTSLQLKVAAPFDAEVLARQIEAQPGIKVESWIETNAEFFKALSGQTMSFFVIRLFVGLTAALGIASVLVVSVVQKSKEIGILRATGTTRGQILGVFLLQGAILGFLGSLFGSIMGWLFLVAWRGFAVNDEGVPFFVLEAGPSLYLAVAAGATVVGTLSALFPAQRAARLDPAVAIRG
jgi:hypothetical protein